MQTKTVKSVAAFVARLQSCINEAGTLYAFLKRTGFPKGTIKGYLKGAEPGRVRLAVLAERIGVTPEWLAYGIGEKHAPATFGWVPIPELKWHLDTATNKVLTSHGTASVMVRVEMIGRSFIGVTTDQLLAFRMPDTSLAPTLLKNEWVILDQRYRDPRLGGIFCVVVEGAVTVRRVGLAGPGRVRISAENELIHLPIEYSLKECGADFDILGEVVFGVVRLNPSRSVSR